ncbi:MAG: SUMF1/EgtB/PvdO family nonheme iron enzyme [Bacteroidales bacterium]|nr:SUMF1/EgtB/PvdO family nonheme iron enzyme [Bacteroidales bacterium]
MQGAIVNGFRLKYLLGEGGMASVWYAENEIGKSAAVKILHEKWVYNEQIVERFHNEALVMVKLNHPNIRQVYSYGYLGNRHCIVMEYLEGDDLGDMIQQGRRFSDAELRRWWNQIVDALNYTHAQGVVHRDIKPSNIFVDTEGNVKLLDFGIAKTSENSLLTHTGAVMGTPMYMSPEQVRSTKRVDYRTDLYSLAVTFVHLLTGRNPYNDNANSPIEIQMSILNEPLDLSRVPVAWRVFLAPYLNKEPFQRPALRYFDGNAASWRMPTPNGSGSRIGLWIGLGVGLFVTILIVLAVVLFQAVKSQKPDYTQTYDMPQNAVQVPVDDFTQQASPMKDITITANGVSFVMKPVERGNSNSFYMSETEVTQALWAAVMGKTLRQQHDERKPNGEMRGEGYNYPMYYINQDDCLDFIYELNYLTGKRFRLPTEAEWEYAARGGEYGEGYLYAGSDYLRSVAWYADNSGESCHPVKSKMPNELGLYDMSGNVFEWCQESGVTRGGSWYSNESLCYVTGRHTVSSACRETTYGLRLVMDR